MATLLETLRVFAIIILIVLLGLAAGLAAAAVGGVTTAAWQVAPPVAVSSPST